MRPAEDDEGAALLSWGGQLTKVREGYLLVRAPRLAGRRIMANEPMGLLDAGLLHHVQPPFAVAIPSRQGWLFAQDELGFRLLYHREGGGWAAVSTSARALALLEPAALDLSNLAVVSLLGWPVGDATPWRGVTVLRHGARLDAGQVVAADETDDDAGPAVTDPVRAAARILRETLTSLLDETPDAVLQLTGGIDSRILLAAVPPGRRKSLTAMTLQTSGSQDVPIANALTARYGMRHVVRDFSSIREMSAEEAFQACLRAAIRLEGAGDPVAVAAVDAAEGDRGPQVRIVGLGGEVARGFYYVGPLWADRVSGARIRRFADWRLFANEAAPREMLTGEFASWSAEEARRRVRDAFLEAEGGWFDLTDAFYLGQRMRRWAGGLASAACLERTDVNPMLDPKFVRLVTALDPSEKANLRFLARLVDHLDPDLARLPLDGRPPPRAYLHASPAGPIRRAPVVARKVVRKVEQRLTSAQRTPEGGALLAAKVADHLRSAPDLLGPAASEGILDPIWLERMLLEEVEPRPSAAALLMTLIAATTE